jgi:hypothetical protein
MHHVDEPNLKYVVRKPDWRFLRERLDAVELSLPTLNIYEPIGHS